MANYDSVSQFYLDSFGYGRVAVITQTQLNTSGNAVITIPILSGGLTAGANLATSGSIIVRRVTINNPNGSVATANVSISATNDGANLVCNAATLTSVSGAGTYQDLAVSTAYGSKAVSGNVTNALYVNVNTASGNNNTVNICVYGDVVTF
jgi:hypothetical protein